MTNLSERVMSLSGPDREVDAEIWRIIHPTSQYRLAPSYTASIDAAMTLVPEGHKYWNLGGSPTRGFAGAGLYGAVIDDQFYGEAQTPALALCAAALLAREASNGDL